MTDKAEQILTQALGLSESERADLEARILLSLEDEAASDADRAWEQEIARRIREIDEGTVRPLPWEVASRELPGG